MQKEPETKVDRSRLTLLLGLSSTAAAAGCAPYGPNPGSTTFDKRQKDPFEQEEKLGGEGEGGGSH